MLIPLFASPLIAATGGTIVVPAGTLADAIAAIGAQVHVDIGGSDTALATIRVKGFTVHGGADRALDRLLAPTRFRAVPIPGDGFRIAARPVEMKIAIFSKSRAAAAVPASAAPVGDIVVVASKRDQLLSNYPGGTVGISPSDDAFGPIGAEGAHWLLDRIPILQSTELGSGRNKLFIRGIADSSFSGPTQATVSTYFGGVRIGYNGPDPNLNLYDLERVEVLEGPQGTLYGAGAIGGIILLTPKPPQLDRAAASAEIGASETQHGGIGYDSAAMVNLAPWTNKLAVRLVAYRSREAGYINDPQRGNDLNALIQTGGRAEMRFRPFDGFTLDASFVAQNSEQPDLQYANPVVGDLARSETLQQPFADHFRMTRFVAEQRFGRGWALQLAGGWITHDTDQRYDATRPAPILVPTAYDESIDIDLKTLEAHLSHSTAGGAGWLVGVSGVWDQTSAGRTFGSLAAPRDLIGVSNRTTELAGYAEWTIPVDRRTAFTIGARYTSARMDGEPSRTPTNRDYINGRRTSRPDPEFGFTHKLSDRLQWFGQYSQGFRTGGLAVARGAGRVASYESDKVLVGQTGLRLFREGDRGIGGYIAISYARWNDIQADLIAANGFPYTANVGDGRILTFEASADWSVIHDVRLRGAVVLARSRLVDPQPDFRTSQGRSLPASPGVTATSRIVWAHKYDRFGLRADLQGRYVGHSRLGVGPTLDIPYGDYAELGTTAAIALKKVEISIGVENLLNSHANRFAIGNPFAIALRNEATPLRPRTVRVGLSTAF